MTTITGTDFADSLNFSALSSAVFVLALGGADFVQGTALADTLLGGTGGDRLVGSAGGDSLVGEAGDDGFGGGAGNDTLDGGPGLDTADYANAPAAVAVDLGAGTAQDGLGGTDLLIAVELVNGSPFDDLLIGGGLTEASAGAGLFESFRGNAGNDTIDGGGTGQDRVDYTTSPAAIVLDFATGLVADGFGGTDLLIDIDTARGSPFDDTLTGGNPLHHGFESFEGREGNDSIDGGAGYDRADYANATGPVIADLAAGLIQDGQGGIDTVRGIDEIRGSAFADHLRGGSDASASANGALFESYRGLAGNDTLDGGGSGEDRADYSQDPGPVAVDLAAGIAFDGYGGIDTLILIDAVRGSRFDDTLAGGNPLGTEIERLEGMAGNDLIDGGADGFDQVSYQSSPGAVVVDLGQGTAFDGFGGIDTLIGIEGVDGSAFADTLIGGAGNELLIGRDGEDSIDGGDGIDDIGFVSDIAGVSVDLALGIATDGFGATDRFANIEGAEGSAFDDLLLGSSGPDVLDGRRGNDTLDGRAGSDVAEFNQAPAGVVVNLAEGTAQDGFGTFDMLIGIEGVRGSAFGDLIFDNAGSGLLEGGDGGDTIVSTGGLDTIHGNGGDDLIAYAPTSLAQGGIIDGGAGYDILLVQIDGIVDLTLVTITDVEQVEIVGSGILGLPAATDQALAFGAGADIIVGRTGNESIDGGGGADTLFGGRGDDSLAGGADGDILVGDEQGAFVGGVPGADTLDGGAGADTLFGQAEADLLWGGAGDDVLLGEDGDDAAQGGPGADTLFGGAGADTLDGGAGDDALVSFAVETETAGGVLIGGEGNDTVFGGAGVESLRGDAGDDVLIGGDGADTLVGGAGDDLIFTGAGADVIVVGAGSTFVADFERGSDRIVVAPADHGLADLAAFLRAVTITPYANAIELSLPGRDFRLTLVGANAFGAGDIASGEIP